MICIGALMFGPIEFVYGLVAKEAPIRLRRPPPAIRTATGDWRCSHCDMPNGSKMTLCVNCGAART